MKRREGSIDWTVERNEETVQVNVDWTWELCEYGDGSDDESFWTDAHAEDGTEIQLTDDENQALKEKLEAWGEFV